MIRTVNGLVAVLFGAAITFSLFYLMQALIATGSGERELGTFDFRDVTLWETCSGTKFALA